MEGGCVGAAWSGGWVGSGGIAGGHPGGICRVSTPWFIAHWREKAVAKLLENLQVTNYLKIADRGKVEAQCSKSLKFVTMVLPEMHRRNLHRHDWWHVSPTLDIWFLLRRCVCGLGAANSEYL